VGDSFYGGQAVIEGVMMRGRHGMAVAVRTPTGEIRVHQEPLTARIYTSRWGRWPFVRGLAMLWDALVLGMRALLWSAEVAAQDEEKRDQPVEFTGPVAWTTIAISLAFAVALFVLLPTVISKWLAGFFGDHPTVDALFEGGLRLILFVLYLWAIGFLPDIRRVFGYHGAEHKAINAYEAGDPLTVESVQRHSVQHTRCGTSFLLYVLVISILLFTPLTFSDVSSVWLALVLRLASRLALVPLVAGIAYEVIRFSARHQAHPLTRLLVLPGLWLQKLTTREPDDGMVECAIAALEPVLAADGQSLQVSAQASEDLTRLPGPLPGQDPALDRA